MSLPDSNMEDRKTALIAVSNCVDELEWEG